MTTQYQPPSSDTLGIARDAELKNKTLEWIQSVRPYRYVFGFTWLGRPIIQHPQDILAIQEIIWRTKPDLIVETGIAHGGSLILSASILELLGGSGEVLGIDIDIREHNRVEIEKHPLYRRISMIEGSSTDETVVKTVYEMARGKERIMVLLDSNHTHDHVLGELLLYSDLVKQGCYLIVMDTTIDDLPDALFENRPWGGIGGNNPRTAVREFLQSNDRFIVDEEIHNRLIVTAGNGGYLKCIKDS